MGNYNPYAKKRSTPCADQQKDDILNQSYWFKKVVDKKIAFGGSIQIFRAAKSCFGMTDDTFFRKYQQVVGELPLWVEMLESYGLDIYNDHFVPQMGNKPWPTLDSWRDAIIRFDDRECRNKVIYIPVRLPYEDMLVHDHALRPYTLKPEEYAVASSAVAASTVNIALYQRRQHQNLKKDDPNVFMVAACAYDGNNTGDHYHLCREIGAELNPAVTRVLD